MFIFFCYVLIERPTIHESKKNKKKGTETLLADIESTVTEIKDILKTDLTREFAKFLKIRK